MADIQRRTRTNIRHEYVIASPATAKDIGLAIHWATQAMPDERRGYDDAYFVEAYDEEVIVWWPEEQVEPVSARVGEMDLYTLAWLRDRRAYGVTCWCGEVYSGFTDPTGAHDAWLAHSHGAHQGVLDLPGGSDG